MQKIKHRVLELLQTFSSEEIKDFGKLIASPLHSKGRNYVPLLNEIVNYNRNENGKISSHELYSRLYPGKKFSSQTLKNRFTELFKLAEEYLVYKRLGTNSFERERLLLEEYLERKLYKLFEGKYRKTHKFVRSLPENDYKFKSISFLKGINLSLLDKRNTIDRMHKQHLERTMYSLYIFLIEIFRQGVNFRILEHEDKRIESNVIENILDKLQIESLIPGFGKSDKIIQKVVCLYYYLYKACEKPYDEKYYFEMRKIFSECNDHFDDEYKEEIYNSIIDYCTMRQNDGIKKFQYELFKVYNEKLNRGLYSQFRQQMFPVNNFRDYVLIGIEIREFKWVENFIRKYSKELPEEMREDETNLSYAKLFFGTQNYNKALDHLGKVAGLNYLHYADASVLKMCCYYELGRIEEAYYETDKLRHYIRNHKDMPAIHKIPNINFLKIYQKLLNNESKPVKSDLGFLREKIHSLKFISKGKWLLEKIARD